MTQARDKANIPVLNFASKGIDDNATSTAITIDSADEVKIGTTTDSWNGANGLVIKEASGDGGITIVSASTSNNGNIGFADTQSSGFSDMRGLITYLHNGDSFRFMTANAERMRINSTGVGIGTSSPIAPLHISGTTPVIAFTETDHSNKQYKVGSFGSAFAIRDDTAGQYRYTIDTNGNHIFNEGSQNTSFRIESNNDANIFKVDGGTDRIGIGESSPLGKLHVKSTDSGVSPSGNADELFIENNGNAGLTIGTSTSGTGSIFFADSADPARGRIRYDQSNDAMTFGTAGAGEHVRITSAGRVGIGTTSPDGTLHAQNGSAGSITAFAGSNLTLEASVNNNFLSFLSPANKNQGILFGDADANFRGQLQYNHDGDYMAFWTAASERMRILSNGNVGIGKTDPTTALQVLGQISLITPTNGNGMSTNCIGTPANYYFDVRDDNTAIFRIISNRRIQTNGTTNRTGHLNLIGEVGSAFKAIVFEHTSDGGEVGTIKTASSSTSYNTSSDYRLKENVSYDFDATTRLKQLKPARFNFIKDADTTVDGFIAHEVSSIVPEAITGEKDALQVWEEADELPDGVSVGDNKLDDNGNTIPDYQGIDQSKLVPLLVKTIQELEARITTLEANN